MKEFVNVIQCGFAAMGGFFGWVMGGFDGFLYALIVFVAVDYLTGLMAAAVEKKQASFIPTLQHSNPRNRVPAQLLKRTGKIFRL